MSQLLLLTVSQMKRLESELLDERLQLRRFLAAYLAEICPLLGPQPQPSAQQELPMAERLLLRYQQQVREALPRWYHRLARHSHPDAVGHPRHSLLFAEATQAYRQRDLHRLRELCLKSALSEAEISELTQEALTALSTLYQARQHLQASREYALWQRHQQAAASGIDLPAWVAEQLRQEQALA